MYKILQFKSQKKSAKKVNIKKSTIKSKSKKSKSNKEIWITNAKFLKKEYKTEKMAYKAISKLQADPKNKGFTFMIVEKNMPKQHLSGCHQGETTDNGTRKLMPCSCFEIEAQQKANLDKVKSLIKELSAITNTLSKDML